MIELNGGPLALDAVEPSRGATTRSTLAPAAIPALARRASSSIGWPPGAEPIYGITTGVGKLKDVVIPAGQRAELQRNLVLSHAGGVGAPLAEPRSARSCCCSPPRWRAAPPA